MADTGVPARIPPKVAADIDYVPWNPARACLIDPPTQAEVQEIADKLNELISTRKRV